MIKLKQISKVVMGVLYIVAGINHFLSPALYLRMMPKALPAHQFLVDLSGVAESVLGILLLVPRTSTRAAWGLILLLIAVFPANVGMAVNPERFPEIPQWAAWIRLPMQAVLIAWAAWHTKPDSQTPKKVYDRHQTP